MTTYPDVPDLPGVPALPRDPFAPVPMTITPVTTDGVNAVIDDVEYTWGIFTLGGSDALVADNVISVGYAKDYNLPDYPIENGGFQTYNKVERAFDAHITVTKGGSLNERSQFIARLDQLLASTDVFELVTPERTYTNANLAHLDYDRRAEAGASMIRANLILHEIRQAPPAVFSNTKSDGAAPVTDGGAVAPAAPSSATTAAVQAQAPQ